MADLTQKASHAKSIILVADGDADVCRAMAAFLESDGHEVLCASGPRQAADMLDAARVDLLIADMQTSGSDGYELLRLVRQRHDDVVVILMTEHGSIESAVDAIRQGAYDYLTKPLIDDDLRLAVGRALRQQHLLAENRRLKCALGDRYGFDNIVGADSRMAKVFDLIDAVADSRTTVLITGESGTGKSLIARAVHAHSSRRNAPFVEVSCGALPDTLLESELFGHMRGAFTHAMADKPGKFAAADGGTIFLDEISCASPQLQVKLLRVLQERQFEPLGSNRTRQVDARVILATNHDMLADVEAGRFRRDLYYRINVVNIDLPPLRDRMGDIQLLSEFFLRKYLPQANKTVQGFAPATMELMLRYAWPGNVRELENCVERAVVLCRQTLIGADDLPPAVLAGARKTAAPSCTPDAAGLHQAMLEPEKQIIRSALQANHGCRQAAARQLGINRTTLYKKMRKHGLLL